MRNHLKRPLKAGGEGLPPKDIRAAQIMQVSAVGDGQPDSTSTNVIFVLPDKRGVGADDTIQPAGSRNASGLAAKILVSRSFYGETTLTVASSRPPSLPHTGSAVGKLDVLPAGRTWRFGNVLELHAFYDRSVWPGSCVNAGRWQATAAFGANMRSRRPRLRRARQTAATVND
jgi:hypothetical protein